jgi:hypothetical protein
MAHKTKSQPALRVPQGTNMPTSIRRLSRLKTRAEERSELTGYKMSVSVPSRTEHEQQTTDNGLDLTRRGHVGDEAPRKAFKICAFCTMFLLYNIRPFLDFINAPIPFSAEFRPDHFGKNRFKIFSKNLARRSF